MAHRTVNDRVLIRIYKLGTRKWVDYELYRTQSPAFSHESLGNTIFLVRMPAVDEPHYTIIDSINHEILHLVLKELEEQTANESLDNVSWSDGWRERPCIGGL